MGAGADSGLVSVADAAERLGLSRLRLREALAAGLLEGVKDNHGHWRVRLDGIEATAIERALRERPAEPGLLIGVLFDEVEELQDQVGERDRAIGELVRLLDRQQAIAERATRLAEAVRPAGEFAGLAAAGERAMALADRALRQAETEAGRAARLSGLLDRSLSAGERLEKAAEDGRISLAEARGAAERQHGMIESLMALVERSLAVAAGGRTKAGRTGLMNRLLGRKTRRDDA